jgi:flavin reductase (DIM6/NTAB) family NADH-FMN oxidoreductase RutF
MHVTVEPKILYFGTPVVLISSLNADGSANLAPMSSAWWLGQTAMLGMSARSQTVANLRRDPHSVLNLPSADLVGAVDRLALLTGRNPVPEYKQQMGYVFQPDKFGVARLTPVPSTLVAPPRVAECPVQLEAVIERMHPFGPEEDMLMALEARILRVHIDDALLLDGHPNYIDPEKWKPLIMSFTEFYGLSGKVHHSQLGEVYGPPAGEPVSQAGMGTASSIAPAAA